MSFRRQAGTSSGGEGWELIRETRGGVLERTEPINRSTEKLDRHGENGEGA